jgi:hypothetical protein
VAQLSRGPVLPDSSFPADRTERSADVACIESRPERDGEHEPLFARPQAGPGLTLPRRVARMLLTRRDALSDSQQALLSKLTAACPEMTSLAGLVRDFAALLCPDPANQARLSE